MGAEAETDQLQLVLDDPINENKVGFNMAVAVAGDFPFERMIVESGRKRLLVAKQVDDGCNLLKAFAATDGKFKVAGELPRKNAIEHGGQAFSSNAAFSISSVLLYGPNSGSVPASMRLKRARVSVFGISLSSDFGFDTESDCCGIASHMFSFV